MRERGGSARVLLGGGQTVIARPGFPRHHRLGRREPRAPGQLAGRSGLGLQVPRRRCGITGSQGETGCEVVADTEDGALSGLEPLTSYMPVSLGMSVPGISAGTGQCWCLVAPGDSLHA
jgi:hypothetical protein